MKIIMRSQSVIVNKLLNL